MIEVILNEIEYRTAVAVGVNRNVQNILLGRRLNRPMYTGWNYDEHIAGACGELVICKTFGLPWTGMGVYRAVDVGPLEVRTRKRHSFDLIVKRDDEIHSLFVLVTGEGLTFRIHGWILGAQAKQEQWWSDKAQIKEPAYFVPRDALLPPERLYNAKWEVSYPHAPTPRLEAVN